MSSAKSQTDGAVDAPRSLDTRPSTPLALRLALIFFSTAFLLVLAASGILYMGTLSALQSADDQVIDKRSAAIKSLLSEPALNLPLLLHEVNDDNQGPRQIFIRVVSNIKDAAVATEGMDSVLPAALFPVPAPGSDIARTTITTPGGSIFRMTAHRGNVAAVPGADAIIQVATDTSLDQQSLTHFRRILLSVIGAALPLCAMLAWLIVRRELSPLSRFSAATNAIDASSMGERLDTRNLPAELHDLAVQFNAMLARLEGSWKDLEHYADTIAHEMRTPLNRMRLDCEIALDKAETSDDLRDVMISSVAECERLTRLLNGLLFLARADNSRTPAPSDKILPAEHIRTVHEFFKADAAERGIALIDACRETPAILADRDLFKQAIANLVSNALAHTPPGGSVTLSCEAAGREAVISIADTGSGIDAQDRPRIFERFYRAAKPRQDDGLGLGLAITKGIAELHGGRISFTSQEGRGTTFTLAFPLA